VNLATIKQAFREESMNRTRRVQTRRGRKREAGQEESKSMLIIFFDMKGVVHKEFVLAGQTVNSAYYCDLSGRLHENVRRIRPELWRQRNWLLHHDKAPSCTFFLQGIFFTKNNITVALAHQFFCFPD
jgi:hypothetical protein